MNRLHIVWAIFWIVVFAYGCAPEIFKPLTPEDELRLHARAMAENICGTGNQMSECYRQALRWYYKLNGLNVDENGLVTAPRYCKPQNEKSRPSAKAKAAPVGEE